MATLTASEKTTLKILSNPDSTAHIKRGHMEKLSRLGLIEPAPGGVKISLKGKQVLVGN